MESFYRLNLRVIFVWKEKRKQKNWYKECKVSRAKIFNLSDKFNEIFPLYIYF